MRGSVLTVCLTSGMVAVGVLFDSRRRTGVLASVVSSTETIGALPTAEAVADILGIETLSPLPPPALWLPLQRMSTTIQRSRETAPPMLQRKKWRHHHHKDQLPPPPAPSLSRSWPPPEGHTKKNVRSSSSERHDLMSLGKRCASLDKKPVECNSSRYGHTICMHASKRCRTSTWWAQKSKAGLDVNQTR
jgi:hypothetical protein